MPFRDLGYRTNILRDDDARPTEYLERLFTRLNGPIFKWREGRALENELFECLPDAAVTKLLTYAVELHGLELVEAHIGTASAGKLSLAACKAEMTPAIRAYLAKACTTKQTPWFKNVSAMEYCAREIIGPALADGEAAFRGIIESVFAWIDDGRT